MGKRERERKNGKERGREVYILALEEYHFWLKNWTEVLFVRQFKLMKENWCDKHSIIIFICDYVAPINML